MRWRRGRGRCRRRPTLIIADARLVQPQCPWPLATSYILLIIYHDVPDSVTLLLYNISLCGNGILQSLSDV